MVGSGATSHRKVVAGEEQILHGSTLIAGQFGNVKQGMGYRISTGVSGANNSFGHSKSLSDDEIRSAMGLKGR